jgi:curved DNA-binding protein CbpA
LHRELARVTHPDLNPEADTLEFKKMQSAYEEADGAYLIQMALDRDIEVDLPDEDLEKIEQNIDKKKEALSDIRESVRWAWANSDKSEDFRAQVRFSLSIDEAAYQEWLKTLDT